MEELNAFIEGWKSGADRMKELFVELKHYLGDMSDIELTFVPREGVTYSLRVKHARQQRRSLFAMIDVIEGDPRWLSICFYADTITDPDEISDLVPEGLMGEDARCFDVEEYSDEMKNYLIARFDEGVAASSKSGD